MTKRVVGGCGAAAAGAGWFELIVTCCPGPTVTVPPAFAVTRIWPSSTLYVAEVVPSAFCVTFVSKAVPRTEATEDGVLISNLESGFSFATAAHERPSVCSSSSSMPPVGRRLRVRILTRAPESTLTVEPSKKVSTARPSLLERTRSPLATMSPSRAGAKSAVPFCASTATLRTPTVAALSAVAFEVGRRYR
jgi:hypothetical protein